MPHRVVVPPVHGHDVPQLLLCAQLVEGVALGQLHQQLGQGGAAEVVGANLKWADEGRQGFGRRR